MLYDYNPNAHTRWASFENPLAGKGCGAMENHGAKGHSFNKVSPGDTVTLMQCEGSGVVRRIWMTLNPPSEYTLRAILIRMYWDGADKPAVECPLGDFFGFNLGRMHAYESELMASPEGRSLLCTIPMPFRKEARIELCNESEVTFHLFYDVDFTLEPFDPESMLYFHAWWNRENPTTLCKDYTILPRLNGHGRLLGVSFGVHASPEYGDTWFGEGIVKVYLDGDGEHPTLAGTGLEDYAGSAWGLGKYVNRTQGCLEAGDGEYSFYRWHIADPIWFHSDISATIQSLGNANGAKVAELQRSGAPLHVVWRCNGFDVTHLYDPEHPYILDPESPDDMGSGSVSFFRQDDYSSVAYFYYGAPSSELPPVQGLEARTDKAAK